ncbi:MAG: transposase [Fimbriimonadaceae bacterium]|nr:transposase [Alphaproteobacteria bacterium]
MRKPATCGARSITEETRYLRRAVDHGGWVLTAMVSKRRDRRAVPQF